MVRYKANDLTSPLHTGKIADRTQRVIVNKKRAISVEPEIKDVYVVNFLRHIEIL